MQKHWNTYNRIGVGDAVDTPIDPKTSANRSATSTHTYWARNERDRTLYDGRAATHWNAFLKMSSVNEENHQHFLISANWKRKTERIKIIIFYWQFVQFCIKIVQHSVCFFSSVLFSVCFVIDYGVTDFFEFYCFFFSPSLHYETKKNYYTHSVKLFSGHLDCSFFLISFSYFCANQKIGVLNFSFKLFRVN